MQALADALNHGVETGELKADAEQVRLAAEVLWDAYVSNYRRALFDDWAIDALVERAREQTRLVLKSLR